MADKKISELDAITGANTAADDYFVVVDTSGSVTKKISRAELNNAIEQDVLAQVSITDLGSDLNTNGNDINFGDNDKAIFGASSDLQIYHDSLNSYISDQGTGNLKLLAANFVVSNAANNQTIMSGIAGGAVTLNYSNNTKLATTASGINVTGSVVSDGLTVDGVATAYDLKAVSNTPTVQLKSPNQSNGYQLVANVSDAVDGGISIQDVSASNAKRLNVGAGGGISFYDSTGVSMGFFWDANEQRLGLGTTTPTNLITLDSTSDLTIRYATGGTSKGYVGVATSAGKLMTGSTTGELLVGSADGIAFAANNARAMTIDSSGNLLHQRTSNTISGTSVNKMTLGNGTGQYGAIIDVGSGSGYYGFAKNGAYNSRIRYNYATDSMAFDVNNSEAMRLDSGGKLNVNNVTGSGRVNISADNWPENALALYSAGIAGQANFAGMGFFNQDADSPIAQTADIYTNPTGTLSLTASGNPAIQLKYGSAGISGGTPALTVDNAGRIGIGTTTPSGAKLKVDGGATVGTIIQAGNAQGGVILGAESSTAYVNTTSVTPLAFKSNNAERMRIDNGGRVLTFKTASGMTNAGVEHNFTNAGGYLGVTSEANPVYINRAPSDGSLIEFRQNNNAEGSITVSGTTVSYNGGHLSRWSRLSDDSKDTTIVKGTVMTNLDEMVEWGDEDNEQLNKMAVSSVEGDANVAGVFVNWDEDDEWNDMNIAMTGDMVIRIAQGTTVDRGDLLMSAGDGTAKPQGDDVVRSKTIAKVTSINVSHTYDDGSYCVPCVLMAC